MAYRAFRRLLGENSLERKIGFLLGGGLFLLIAVSFAIYGYQTEKLVWAQTKLTADLLVNPILLKRHWHVEADRGEVGDVSSTTAPAPSPFIGPPSTTVTGPPSKDWIEDLTTDEIPQQYDSRFLRPYSDLQDFKPRPGWEREALRRLESGKAEEEWQIDRDRNEFEYLRRITLSQSCLDCHPTALDRRLGKAEFVPGEMIAAAAVVFPLRETELAVNINRAYLISFALITVIAAVLFALVTIRYVIVKPVAHLKEVSDEIASGNLAIRSNIQTGDEFQELSLAYNRMIRSLVSMQDDFRRLNRDLDQKLDELARANLALFEMNRLKSEFLATISHELRTPLNSILGFSDLLAEIPSLDAKQRKWNHNIQSSGKLLLNLINDILDLAKLEAGKMQLHLEEFSLRDLVESEMQTTKPLADKKNISIRAEIDPTIPILRQDNKKLAQVLSNFLSNAIKFTPEGGQIVVTCQADRAHLLLTVTDNGIGISPADQKLIFEKFRQSESSLTRNHGGTGLGLSIVRELVKLLGGDEVRLESELGRGSSFTVRIPMHLEDAKPTELGLEAESFGLAKDRQQEVRYFTSKHRAIRSGVGS